MKTPPIPESLVHMAADQAVAGPPPATPAPPRQRLWNVVSKRLAASGARGGDGTLPDSAGVTTWLRQALLPLRWGCPVPLGRVLAAVEAHLSVAREAPALHDAPNAPTRPATDLDRCRWLAQTARSKRDTEAVRLADALEACAAVLAARRASRGGG